MRFLIALALAAMAGAQQLTFPRIQEKLLEERLRQAHPKDAERYRRLKLLFEQAGCTPEEMREQRVRGSKEPNVICGSAGVAADAGPILIGAHFDASRGEGVVDNWSGVAIMVCLREAFGKIPHRHPLEFIGFAAEERGLLGSNAYVDALDKPGRKRIAAVIIMEALGLGPLKYWPNGSNRQLARTAVAVGQSLGIQFNGLNLDMVATADSAPFYRAGIPVLCLHSMTALTLSIPGSHFDKFEAVSWRDYAASQRLVAALLAHLDQTLP